MKQSYHDENEHRMIEDKAKELAGCDDAALLQMADEADKAWREELASNQKLKDRYDREADQQFAELMAKVRDNKPASETTDKGADWQGRDNPVSESLHKKHKVHKRIFIGLIAAVILVAGGGMAAVGRNGYRFNSYPTMTNRSQLARYNNRIHHRATDSLDDIYQKIEDELGIPVLILDWRSDDMNLIGYAVYEDRAVIEFEYQGEKIYLTERKPLLNRISGITDSDRQDDRTVYNRWLDQELMIQRNSISEEKTEYSVEIARNNGHYYLEGIIDYDEFEKLVTNLVYKKNDKGE